MGDLAEFNSLHDVLLRIWKNYQENAAFIYRAGSVSGPSSTVNFTKRFCSC